MQRFLQMAKRRRVDIVKEENLLEHTSSQILQVTESVKRKREKHSNKYYSKEIPSNFHTVLKHIQNMRSQIRAPVDVLGCSSVACAEDPKHRRLEVLVGLMLSSQTKDADTAQGVQNLRNKLPGGITVTSIMDAKEADLAKWMHPVGLQNRKAHYLKVMAQQLHEKFNNDVPNTLSGLLELKGVGMKMAHLTLLHAWGIVEGIGVDTHVHRIANRLGWVHTNDAEQTRQALEAWLPKAEWATINHLLVGFGQTICSAVLPMCQNCEVLQFCSFGATEIKRQKRKGISAQKNIAAISTSETGTVKHEPDIELQTVKSCDDKIKVEPSGA